MRKDEAAPGTTFKVSASHRTAPVVHRLTAGHALQDVASTSDALTSVGRGLSTYGHYKPSKHIKKQTCTKKWHCDPKVCKKVEKTKTVCKLVHSSGHGRRLTTYGRKIDYYHAPKPKKVCHDEVYYITECKDGKCYWKTHCGYY